MKRAFFGSLWEWNMFINDTSAAGAFKPSILLMQLVRISVYLRLHVQHSCVCKQLTTSLKLAVLLMLTSLLQTGEGGRGFSLPGPPVGSQASSLPSKSKTCCSHNKEESSLSLFYVSFLFSSSCKMHLICLMCLHGAVTDKANVFGWRKHIIFIF